MVLVVHDVHSDSNGFGVAILPVIVLRMPLSLAEYVQLAKYLYAICVLQVLSARSSPADALNN